MQEHYLRIVRQNNEIINQIKDSAQKIATQRKDLNQRIGQHYMKNIWRANQSDVVIYKSCLKEIEEISNKVTELEKLSKLETGIQRTFNGILKLLGLSEYELDECNRLILNISDKHDISYEGQRISTAQRKMLSLCYFFAELVSTAKTTDDLSNYILMFDDPVDSADYIYFYGISTLIENSSLLLSKLLERKIDFGQTFVFTHNTLLHDRLATAWKGKNHKHLVKENNISKFVEPAGKVNYYGIYLKEIISYYKAPEQEDSKMVTIGNFIRRVLEILVSFNNMGNNDFGSLTKGLGQTKLALIANHMSHESYVKILNPLPNSNDLQEACGELLDLIKDNFPTQYIYLKEEYSL